MRTFIMLVFIALLLTFGGIALYRLVGEENMWVCTQGQWKKQGQPIIPPPSEPCFNAN